MTLSVGDQFTPIDHPTEDPTQAERRNICRAPLVSDARAKLTRHDRARQPQLALMAEIRPSLRIPRAPFKFGKCATSEPAELSRGGVEFLRMISAARLECGEPSAKPSELIRRQRGNSFGYFFYSHLGSIALQRLGGLWRVRAIPCLY